METNYITVPNCTKLTLLQRDAFGIEWPNLDHENWCLHCGKAFTGRSVRILRSATGDFLLECGTPGCDGSPIDWAPYPWWDDAHPVTLAHQAAKPGSRIHHAQPEDPTDDLEALLLGDPGREDQKSLRTATDSIPASLRARIANGGSSLFSSNPGTSRSELPHPQRRLTKQDSPSWVDRLQRLEEWLLDDLRYEVSWDFFLQEFVANPRFIASSHQVPRAPLKQALQTIVHQVFRQQFPAQQILVMQLEDSGLFHGVVHSGADGYLFYYLERIDYGFLRPLTKGETKTVVARFRIAQPKDTRRANDDA